MGCAKETDVEIFIDGVRIEGTTSVEWELARVRKKPAPKRPRTVSYEVSYETTMPKIELERMFRLASSIPTRRGPTPERLLRRAFYGGRKGRSALRRIEAEGYAFLFVSP